MNRIAGRSAIVLLLCLLLVAGAAFFVAEFVSEADEWVVFPGSPHLYNGGNIGCGTVVDMEGKLLLDLKDGRTYSNNRALRESTVHWVGDIQGRINAPALSTYAAQLAGFDLVNGVYGYGKIGGTATLTLSSSAQMAALEALEGHSGTVAVYNYKTGALLCAVTTPTFDPYSAPDSESAEDGIYFNRFIQSAYTPGSIFKIVTLAAALEEGGFEEESYFCDGGYEVDGETISCDGIHGDQDLKTAFRNSCNCAFAQIALSLGPEKLQRYMDKFGVTGQLEFDGVTTVGGNFDLSGAKDFEVGWSGIGQYTDQMNPCAFLTFVGALASEGRGAQPFLVQKVESGSLSSYKADPQLGKRIVSASTAETIQEYMRANVSEKYGDDYFPGLNVCAKTGTGEVGGGKKPNATLSGFVTDEAYPFAFVIFIEDAGYGGSVCLPIASKVLAACKLAVDTYGQ